MYKPDFVSVRTKTESNGPGDKRTVFYPDYKYIPSADLMIRGRDFYAVWDEDVGLWSQSLNRLCDIIDDYMDGYAMEQGLPDSSVMHLRDDSTRLRTRLVNYFKQCEDNFEELDPEVTFLGEAKPKSAHISTCVPYKLESGEPELYDELMGILYSDTEREKLEWAVGSIIAGDSKKLQKFIVLYGESGTGKSTFLRIVAALFPGKYLTTFDANSIGSNKNFVLDVFRENPLVAIQDDGDLSKIKDNTKLNQIVSHESLLVEEKYKASYSMSIKTFLFIGTNRPVEITETRSGLLRRLIDVKPTGSRMDYMRFSVIFPQLLTTELGKIARRCLDVYLRLGEHAYDTYVPETMLGSTNQVYNFISDNLEFFVKNRQYCSRESIWQLYKAWCEDSGEIQKKRIVLGVEMQPYYHDYKVDWYLEIGGAKQHMRNVFFDFKQELFDHYPVKVDQRAVEPPMLILDKTDSWLEREYASYPAQYFTEEGDRLERKWDNCMTRLSDINTSRLHGVRYEPNHVVIDFDLKDAMGNKDAGLNLAAAAKWPDTYAEFSKSGAGVHLHYLYAGDPEELAAQVAPHIDIRTMVGKSCDRRAFTLCNDKPVAILSDGVLPKKGERRRKVIDIEGFKDEKLLRNQIKKTLRKEVHPHTTPSVDFIAKLLDEAYASGKFYDVRDLMPAVQVFANNSTNQSVHCIKKFSEMKFCCADAEEPADFPLVDKPRDDRRIIPNEELTFYDIEIFSNVFIICYKHYGKNRVMKLINPSAEEVRKLYDFNLVGFNNRGYDNHLIWAAGMLNYNPYQLYCVSKKIIDNDPSFRKYPQAYGISYTDVYDFAAAPNKMGLKKWEIKLGLTHIENQYDWDEPLPESHWFEVCEYCANDVLATEALFDHLHDDYTARCILAELADSTPNQSTRNLMKRIIFGDDKNPRAKLVYTDLSEDFPGYKFEGGVSTYKGYKVGEGGFVYAEPGIYSNVETFDVASMHPASCIALNYLGPYTQKYAEIRQARIFIKHGDYDGARGLLDGVLGPFLDDPDMDPKNLANALKTALNSLYGYTKMTTALDFVHPKNKDNIIAKRGALFMINLLEEVKARGGHVVHIKTDSIKVVDPDEELEEFIFSYGEQWGYEFEIESCYDRMALVNDAVYIAHDDDGWHATGQQFAEPYVYKTLFSLEDTEFNDYTVTKTVSNKGKMYIDIDKDLDENKHTYKFVGAVGRFCPVNENLLGGGPLLVLRGDKYNAVTGTKGYCWKEADLVKEAHEEDSINTSYFEALADKAVNTIAQYGDFKKFVKGEI